MTGDKSIENLRQKNRTKAAVALMKAKGGKEVFGVRTEVNTTKKAADVEYEMKQELRKNRPQYDEKGEGAYKCDVCGH